MQPLSRKGLLDSHRSSHIPAVSGIQYNNTVAAELSWDQNDVGIYWQYNSLLLFITLCFHAVGSPCFQLSAKINNVYDNTNTTPSTDVSNLLKAWSAVTCLTGPSLLWDGQGTDEHECGCRCLHVLQYSDMSCGSPWSCANTSRDSSFSLCAISSYGPLCSA